MRLFTKRELLALTPEQRKEYDRQRAEYIEAAERERVEQMTDTQVLEITNNGTYGAGIVGKALAERAARVKLATGDGRFGPAITDPDYAEKEALYRAAGKQAQAAERALLQGILPDHDRRAGAEELAAINEAEEDIDPWRATSLSGAKLLAQKYGVSHKPGIKRGDLIMKLQAVGGEPPPVPKDDDEPGAEE